MEPAEFLLAILLHDTFSSKILANLVTVAILQGTAIIT